MPLLIGHGENLNGNKKFWPNVCQINVGFSLHTDFLLVI